MKSSRQNGFALIFSMLILVLLTIVVVGGARTTLLNEWMAGSYMDRTRAYQAAEQAIQQAKALMTAKTAADVNNAELCLDGCAVNAAGVVVEARAGTGVDALPGAWDSTAAVEAVGTGAAKGQYSVTLLANTFLPPAKGGCKAYSIMGRGQGLEATAVVVLQTVALVCPF